ncbi:MAG: CDP-alcohol phosphatidyltransferase family protein, partial [Planctomycetota bacterium]
MAELTNQPGRESLLRRVRRQRLKYITILPSLVTILNGLCGFTAIVFTAKATSLNPQSFSYSHLPMSYLAMAGYMIILAMIADMLDGRLARMSKSTSSFGGQLDSL